MLFLLSIGDNPDSCVLLEYDNRSYFFNLTYGWDRTEHGNR